MQWSLTHWHGRWFSPFRPDMPIADLTCQNPPSQQLCLNLLLKFEMKMVIFFYLLATNWPVLTRKFMLWKKLYKIFILNKQKFHDDLLFNKYLLIIPSKIAVFDDDILGCLIIKKSLRLLRWRLTSIIFTLIFIVANAWFVNVFINQKINYSCQRDVHLWMKPFFYLIILILFIKFLPELCLKWSWAALTRANHIYIHIHSKRFIFFSTIYLLVLRC